MNNQKFFNSFYFIKPTFNKNHQTDHLWESGSPTNYLGFMVSGNAKLTTADKTLYLNAGDCFFIPKGCRYRSFWYPQDHGSVSWYSFGFDYLPVSGDIVPDIQKIARHKNAEKYLELLTQSLQVNCQSVGYLYAFLGEIAKDLSYISRTVVPVEKANDLIRKNPRQKISNIAAACGISESGLYYSFKKTFGITPNRARQMALCSNAVELLSTTDLSVEEISSRLGFSSSSYFRKVFRSCTQHTPREIRHNSQF